jgi:hypothetical protein
MLTMVAQAVQYFRAMPKRKKMTMVTIMTKTMGRLKQVVRRRKQMVMMRMMTTMTMMMETMALLLMMMTTLMTTMMMTMMPTMMMMMTTRTAAKLKMNKLSIRSFWVKIIEAPRSEHQERHLTQP